ncbi:MAG: polyphosphate kinase 1, partial [Spirulinaceae cyanobacterium]
FGGSAVRLELTASTPDHLREMLAEELFLAEEDVYICSSFLGMSDLMNLMEIPRPDLKYPIGNRAIPPRLQRVVESQDSDNAEEENSFFDVISKGDLLVHHPYHSFRATVQSFITHAADDPHVLAIKMTLYRTSGDSPIVKALISAARNGKQVVALVELKARFDEQNNILWARKLERAGVHVVYGLVGLKTHTKITLVVRQEKNKIRRYFHVGTGNYNPKTAKLYTDLGLLSCREELGADLTDLFNYLTGYSRQKSYRKLLVAPVNLRDRMTALIKRETEQASQGNNSRIIAKMNSLVDPQIITALYEASQVGVKIDLIIRGICCLRPGVKGVSENIRVISIISRLLEHSRIFYFHNGGEDEMYIGSADWMRRNLDRRVEAVTPIEDPEIFQDLQEILGIMLADNRHAWELQTDGNYKQRKPEEGTSVPGSQETLMTMAWEAAHVNY